MELEIKKKVDEANAILIACDPENAEEMHRLFAKYNVSKEDEPHVKDLSRKLRAERAQFMTLDAATDPNESISHFGAWCSAGGLGAGGWAIYESPISTARTYVWGVGGGATVQIPHVFQYGDFKVKTSYLGSKKSCRYQINSFAFIVSYTNINLFDDDGWVGTFHGAGFSAGINISGGVAEFTNVRRQIGRDDSPFLPSTIASAKSIFAVTNPRNNNLEVLLIADDKVYRNFFDGTWHNWSPDALTPASAKSIFAVANPRNNNLEVLLIADNKVYHNFFDGAWHNWSPNALTPASAKSIFAIANPRNNNLEVLLIGTDNKVYHNFFDGAWHNWSPDALKPVSAKSIFAVANYHRNTLEVFLIGTGGVYQNFFDGAWHNWARSFV